MSGARQQYPICIGKIPDINLLKSSVSVRGIPVLEFKQKQNSAIRYNGVDTFSHTRNFEFKRNITIEEISQFALQNTNLRNSGILRKIIQATMMKPDHFCKYIVLMRSKKIFNFR